MDFKKRVGRFPCGMCKTKCVTNCLKCSECNLWYHSNCQYVSQSDLQIWGEMDLEFICRTCRTVDGKGFDYLMGIERLHKVQFVYSGMVNKHLTKNFFNHVREKLGSDKLTFGTDDERGLRNALKISFPNSTFLICTKHLKDNIRHQLRKNGTNAHTVQKILESLFSEDSGLVFSRNDDDFAQREDNLSVFFKESPYFRQYYEKYLAEKIKDMIYKPLRDRKITKLWTNNNAESVNNRLKQETQHKILPAPELIQKLSSVVQSQLLNLRRALYGNGNFKLFGKSEKLLIDESVWHEKSHKEKQKQFENLLGMTLGTEPDDGYIRSTDGHIKLNKPRQTAGKKPGQRKRPAAERTTSVRHTLMYYVAHFLIFLSSMYH